MPLERDERRSRSEADADPGFGANRIASLDAFRGAIIVAMILVNNPGESHHVYSQLAHVEWVGLTFTDFIAPALLWVVGVTTSLSLGRRRQAGDRRSPIRHVAVRAASLFWIGVVLGLIPSLLPGATIPISGSVQLMGILQRIAVAYLFGSVICLHTGTPGRAVFAALFLVVYWLAMVGLPGPLSGTGPYDPIGNLPRLVDRWVLGGYAESGSHALLTVLPVTATVLIGAIAGDVLLAKLFQHKTRWLVSTGIALAAIGLIMGYWVPVIRRLWTPSFTLLTAGMAMVAFGGIYQVMDVARVRSGFGWLVACGASPLLLFVLSEVVREVAGAIGFVDGTGHWRSLWDGAYEICLRIAAPVPASAIFALIYTACFVLLALALRRGGFIVKI